MNISSPAIYHIKAVEGTFNLKQPKRPQFLLKLVRLGFGTLGRLFPKPAAMVAYRLFATPRVRAVHKKSDPILEKARLFEVLYGKRILKAYEWGSGDKIVLLAHGWESRGTALRTFAPKLVEAGYRVVAFDGPAHGDSEGKRTNIVHFAGAVLAMIRHLGNIDSIISHSFGGAASMFALRKEHDSIQLNKIVLIGVPARMTKIFEDAKKTMGLPANVYRELLKYFTQLVNMPIQEVNISSSHTHVKINEALIVHDIHDPVVDFEYSCRVAREWPDARLISTENMGHYSMVKHPEVIEKVTDFIIGEKF